jgi:hypothetical protein
VAAVWPSIGADRAACRKPTTDWRVKMAWRCLTVRCRQCSAHHSSGLLSVWIGLVLTQVLPTQVLPTQVLPTQVLPTQVLLTQVLPTQVLPTQVLRARLTQALTNRVLAFP